MSSFTEILTCDGTALYEINKQDNDFKTSGQLRVFMAFDGMVLLKLNEFQYSVNPTDQIIYNQNDPQFSIILYLKKYPSGQWVLKINQHADEVFSCLNQKCYLKNKNGKQSNYSNTKQKQKQQKIQKVQKKVQKKKNSQVNIDHDDDDDDDIKEKQQLSAQTVLVGASKGIGMGLAFTGKILSRGFQSVGGLISKAVKPATQKVEVSEETKNGLEAAKKTSKNVLNFTADKVGKLFNYGKNAASNLGQKIQESDTGKSVQENQYYKPVKQSTKTGVKVFSNLYSGVVTAVYEMGSGISKGTTKVIGAKYGSQVEEAADQALEGAGNVLKIIRIPEDQVAKTLKQ